MQMLGTQRLSELQMCSQAQPTLFFDHEELDLDLQGLSWRPPQSFLIKGDKLGFGSSGVLTKHHAQRGLLETLKDYLLLRMPISILRACHCGLWQGTILLL